MTDKKPHTLAEGDRVLQIEGSVVTYGDDSSDKIITDRKGEVVENDGSGFTILWIGMSPELEHFEDGKDWPFQITSMPDIS